MRGGVDSFYFRFPLCCQPPPFLGLRAPARELRPTLHDHEGGKPEVPAFAL
jgi:hypothetical protein